MEQVFQKVEAMKSAFDIRFDAENMYFMYKGKLLCLKIKDASQRLFKASDEERNEFKISPSGYGVHWPKIDEDLSFAGLAKAAQVLK